MIDFLGSDRYLLILGIAKIVGLGGDGNNREGILSENALLL